MIVHTMKCPECGDEMTFDTGAVVPKMADYPERIVLSADERHTCRKCRIVINRHMTRTFVHEKSEVVPPRWLTNQTAIMPQTTEITKQPTERRRNSNGQRHT